MVKLHTVKLRLTPTQYAALHKGAVLTTRGVDADFIRHALATALAAHGIAFNPDDLPKRGTYPRKPKKAEDA